MAGRSDGRQDGAMSPPLILCGVADDESADDVLAVARRLAQLAACEVRYAHVAGRPIPPAGAYGPFPGVNGPVASTGPADLERLVDLALEGGAALLTRAGVEPEEMLLAVGDPAEALDQLAGEHDAGLVVVGTRGRGAVGGALLGSVSRALARRISRPLLITRSRWSATPGSPVLCGADPDEPQARSVIAAAATLAGRLDRPLLLAAVLGGRPDATTVGAGGPPTPPVDEAEVEAALTRLDGLRTELDVPRTEVVALQGAPAAELDRLAAERGAELLVVGYRGGGALRTVLTGSVSLELARGEGCPVVVVGPEVR